jgi:NADPH:quinone reductase-like Zn-dependent oxidoreductase
MIEVARAAPTTGSERMRAVVYREYGPPEVLRLEEVEKPVPKDNEVLVRIHATSVTSGDCNARNFVFVPPGFKPVARLMFGLRRPTKPVLGMDFAGEVEATGSGVRAFAVGDRVFGTSDADMGAYAEYICRPEAGALAHIPAGLGYAEAAAVPFGGLTALIFLRDRARVQRGQKVLIVGASGGVGAYAVQIAHHLGGQVTGVCSGRNADLVRSLGAARVIDYAQEEFAQSGDTYDVIFDTVGKSTFAGVKSLLTANGLYLSGAGGPGAMVQVPWTALTSRRKVLAGPAIGKQEHMLALAALLESGAIRPVVDRQYSLEEIVDAHRYVDQGHKRGAVVIAVTHTTAPQSAKEAA